MVIAGDTGKYLAVNQAACDLFGYSREQMLNMSVGDLRTVEAPGALEQYRTYVQTGRETGEFTFVRADIQVRTASYTACRVAPDQHLSILRDITLQKEAEEQLRQSETRFRLLIDQSPSSIQILSPDGFTLRVNRAWEQLWNLTMDDIRDYNMLQDKQLVAKGIMPYIQRGFSGEAAAIPPALYDPEETLPDRKRTPNPQRRTQAFIYPVKDASEQIIEVVLIHEDITERVQAEEALRRSEERYRSLVIATSQIVWTTDPAGAIVDRLDSWEEFTGQTQAEYTGWGWSDAVHPEDWVQIERVWKEAMPSRRMFECQYRLRYHDGTYRHMMARGVPMPDERGRIREWVGTNTDITEQVQHVTEIESLNARLKRSIQETHHRVKNNLQIISALSEIQISEGHPTVPITAVIRIGQHSRLLAAIHDLLTQQAKSDEQIDTFSTLAAMDRLLPLLEATTGGRKIHYQVDDILLSVQKGTSLALLVSELISNAVKHGKGDIELTFKVTGESARLEICDDGPGFPDTFDPQTAANTGLSLIDSTGRFELRGNVEYENRSEGGARVIVTFPLA